MPPRNWIRLAFLLAILTSCARSSSIIEDEPFDDDDAGFTGIGDDGGSDPNGDGSAGDGGSQQDGGSGGGTNSDGGPGLDGGPDGDAPHPCEGVTCNSPPANTCADAQKLRVYEPVGVCNDDGDCVYEQTEINCPYGCSNGFCKDCAVDGDCGPGRYCNAGVCASCNVDLHCGTSCENCAVSNRVCHEGACIQCMSDDQCGPGRYCSGNTCFACDTAQKCGPSCVTCSGATPVCNGTSCVCNETSCGANEQCVGGSCEVCKSDSACGSTCSPCGGSTPFCKDEGSTSRCVECLTDLHCAQDEVCRDGACMPACSPTGAVVFSDAFTSPSSSSWTTGTNVAVGSSRWSAYTNARHGVRINNGRLEITNKTSGSAAHGHGYAYVKTGGADSVYDNSQYDPVLSANTGREIVWTLNMRRSNPTGEWATNGGFKCSSSSSQNGNSLGLAYVLAMDAPDGLNSSTSTCSSSASGSGYAVIVGGSRKVRLVRFTGGLRNGTITDLVASGDFSAVSDYFSVRVTYNANTHQWKLEARRDGTSSFSDPASGSYSFTGTAYDSTYVNVPLAYSGPYFQTGCCCLCNETYEAYFDNVTVTSRCAP